MEYWIARNKDRTLCLHDNYSRPYLYDGKYWAVSLPEYERRINKREATSYYNLSELALPEITFENSPQKVKLEVVNGNKPTRTRKDLLYDFYNEKTKEELIEILLQCNGVLACREDYLTEPENEITITKAKGNDDWDF